MKYESLEVAIAENKNGTIYMTRSVEPPCGPCCMGADYDYLAIYGTEKEALAEVEELFAEHRCECENYILEVVKADVDENGEIEVDEEPIRSIPDDKYWSEHADEWNDDYECWVGMEPNEDD